jgi:nucleoside-diphosphate-sugar epimerase
MNRLVVTGARSFIGRALRKQVDAEVHWTGIDLWPAEDCESISADISLPGWEDLIPDGADAIVHLAAISRDADCRKDPVRAFAVNVTGTMRVIEAARRRRIRQIVFASSEWVYGDIDASLKNEDTPIDAASIRSEYPLTKLAGERLLWMAANGGSLEAATVLRFGIVYGPRAGNWSAVEALHDAVARLDKVEVGSLATARRFIHVDDVARGILAALGAARSGYEVFNLTGDSLISLGDVIRESARLGGRAPQVVEKSPESASVRNIDNARARASLGWTPRVDLSGGLVSLGAAAEMRR